MGSLGERRIPVSGRPEHGEILSYYKGCRCPRCVERFESFQKWEREEKVERAATIILKNRHREEFDDLRGSLVKKFEKSSPDLIPDGAA
jgi:transcriptional regulator NrdR family protein